jgi:hypothetical protein
MTVNGSGAAASPVTSSARLFSYCAHDGAREIRMYMPYGEASAVRLRLCPVLARDPRWRHISAIHEIPHGWAWTLCNECPAGDSREVGGT